MKLWWYEVCDVKLNLMDGTDHPWGYQILLEDGLKIMGYIKHSQATQHGCQFKTLAEAKAWVEAMYALGDTG